VRATDSGGLTFDKSFSITINDVAEGTVNDGTFIGTADADVIIGDQGDNTLIGGGGDGRLTGGAGNDLFILTDGSGNDTITDFVAGAGTDDVLDISAFGFASLFDVFNAVSQIGNDTLVQFDIDDSVTLLGVISTDLDANDFLF
jgi:Ca2+-binding RTX toxin-like protein